MPTDKQQVEAALTGLGDLHSQLVVRIAIDVDSAQLSTRIFASEVDTLGQQVATLTVKFAELFKAYNEALDFVATRGDE